MNSFALWEQNQKIVYRLKILSPLLIILFVSFAQP